MDFSLILSGCLKLKSLSENMWALVSAIDGHGHWSPKEIKK